MKVLHVINGLGTGGAERSLAELLPLLAVAGIDSSVACLVRKPEGVHAQVEAAGYPVTVIGSDRLSAVRRLRALITADQPDVVHTTIFEADVIGRVAAAGQRCKVVSSIVNTTYDGLRLADTQINPAKFAAAKMLDRVTARRLTDHFHAISPAVRDSAIAHLGLRPERVTVIERGRDLARLGRASIDRRNAVRAMLGVPADAEVVLSVGRQEPQKDQALLLRAVATLTSTRPRLTVLHVGRAGKATAELERLAATTELAGRVRFLGHRDDVGDLLAASDVFAFPSVYEGLGGSVLEAMALGAPVVVSDAPALVDVVEGGRGGLVVPVGDAAALAAAVERLLDDRALAAALAQQARQIFADRFTLERSAGRMVDMYAQVAGARSRC